MLTSLRFTNFKSWAKADLACGKITGIFGTNSSGKTSLLQFLLMLKQTRDATDRAVTLALDGHLVKLGAIKDAIHRHDDNLSIEFCIDFLFQNGIIALGDKGSKNRGYLEKEKSMKISASISAKSRAPKTNQLIYEFGNTNFLMKSLGPNDHEF